MKEFKIKAKLCSKSICNMTDEEYVQNFINLIRKQISKYEKNNTIKEDLVQDCIISILKVKDKIIKESNPKSFLITVIKNTIIDKKKSKNSVYVNNNCKCDYEEIIDKSTLNINNIYKEDIIKILNKNEIKIINMLYNNKTQKEIGKEFNLSQQRISNIIKNIRIKLNNNNIYY